MPRRNRINSRVSQRPKMMPRRMERALIALRMSVRGQGHVFTVPARTTRRTAS